MAGFSAVAVAPLGRLGAWWRGDEPPLPELGDLFFDEVVFALAQHPPAGVEMLRRALRGDHHDRWAGALAAIACPDLADGQTRAALLEAVRHGSLTLRIVAVRGLIRLHEFVLTESELVVLTESDPLLAAWVVVYRSSANSADAVAVLGAALADPNHYVRELACDEIGERGLRELLEPLRWRLRDPDRDVADAARAALGNFE